MPSSDASNPGSGQPVRHKRLNSDRLERKRATDRETQRAIRAKTKSYIEHLESTVHRYEQTAGDALTRELAAKVSEQHLEISRLREVVKNAHKILAFAIDREDTTSKPDEPAQSSNVDEAGQGKETSSTCTVNAPHSVLNPITLASLPQADADNTPMKGVENPTSEATMEPPVYQHHSSSENRLACGNGDSNYFELLSMELTSIQNDTSFCPLTSAEEDEDVAIRAIFESWNATEQRHRLDPVWKLLKAMDQGLFYRSGRIARVAVLRLMRAMLLYRINPFWQHPTPQLPAYMMACEDQLACPHLSIIDFFVWPTLRAFLITRSITYLPEYSAALFAENLSYRWQYEPEDVFMTHQLTGRYIFSDPFKRSLDDLANWSLKEPFFQFAPGLAEVIPVSNHRSEPIEFNPHGNGVHPGTGLCGDLPERAVEFGHLPGIIPPQGILASHIDLDAFELSPGLETDRVN